MLCFFLSCSGSRSERTGEIRFAFLSPTLGRKENLFSRTHNKRKGSTNFWLMKRFFTIFFVSFFLMHLLLKFNFNNEITWNDTRRFKNNFFCVSYVVSWKNLRKVLLKTLGFCKSFEWFWKICVQLVDVMELKNNLRFLCTCKLNLTCFVSTEVFRYKFLKGTGTYIEGDLFAGWIEGAENLDLITRENLQ